MNKCFFLDRDGVIIKDRKNIYKINDIFFLPGVFEALKELKNRNYLIILITNQSVVGRGIISENDLNKFHSFIYDKLYKRTKLKLIDETYFCPHHPTRGIGKYKIKCKCRKPGNKMLEDAISKWNINRKMSYMIGDKFSDYLASKKSKIKFYYKNNNNFKNQILKILNEKIN